MEQLYPLTFVPVYKEKIWGGDKIRTVLGKDYPGLANCGETWEVSGIEGEESVVAEGALAGRNLREIVAAYGAELVGERTWANSGADFPLLVKFISAQDDLSIQVHPDDEAARREGLLRGKTEMWYVLDADPGACLVSGFSRPISREEYLEYFHSGRLEEILHREPVHRGDCFFLPPGRVHSIGRGILLAEIQQAADVTYRIYDFERRDAQGRLRELHVEKALEAMDFSASGDPKVHYTLREDALTPLAECPYFSTGLLHGRRPLQRETAGEFVIHTCVGGRGRLRDAQGRDVELHPGVCVLTPACLERVEIVPGDMGVELLETRPA